MPSRNTVIDPYSAAIAERVRALLTRKGIRKMGHTKKLKEILNLSLAQAHRKLNGSSWDLAQIRKVAEYFGEPFDSLSRLFESSDKSTEDSIPAILFIGQREFPCAIQIGAVLHTISNVDFLAYENGTAEWCVCEASAATDNVKYYKVKKLELTLKETQKLSVAVLDDDEASADSLSEYLAEVGFHADAYYDLETLIQEVTEGPSGQFDAFVIDWLISGRTAESLIQVIRGKENHKTPIFLLTGEISTGRALESDVARIIMNYNVSLHEKPTRLSIIAAELSKTLGA
jgi:CheY-like chemotaxis protein